MKKKKILVGLAVFLVIAAILAVLCLLVFAFGGGTNPSVEEGEKALISVTGPRVIFGIPELQKISEGSSSPYRSAAARSSAAVPRISFS